MTTLNPAALPAKYGRIVSAFTSAYVGGGIQRVKEVLSEGGNHRVFKNGHGPDSILDGVQIDFLAVDDNKIALESKLDELLMSQLPANAFSIWKFGASAAAAACRPAYLSTNNVTMFEPGTDVRYYGNKKITTIVPTHDIVEIVMFSDLKGSVEIAAAITNYEQTSNDQFAVSDAARASQVV